MIARIWKGAVRREDGAAYASYMQTTGIAGYARTPGNRAVLMLRREVGDRCEFVMVSLWDSMAAVTAFAGPSRSGPCSTRRTTATWSNVT
jgi:heme-degrading monooxygenase HmoA